MCEQHLPDLLLAHAQTLSVRSSKLVDTRRQMRLIPEGSHGKAGSLQAPWAPCQRMCVCVCFVQVQTRHRAVIQKPIDVPNTMQTVLAASLEQYYTCWMQEHKPQLLPVAAPNNPHIKSMQSPSSFFVRSAHTHTHTHTQNTHTHTHTHTHSHIYTHNTCLYSTHSPLSSCRGMCYVCI